MDEERSSSILRFLFKLIIIVIFILFIIWLLSLAVRKGNSNSINNGTTSNTNSKTSISYDVNYQDNLDRMKDAGISYYTVERLPQNVGDTKKMTLEDMYNSHLLLEIVDVNGKKCSSYDSYVEVTKLENEYKMKVRLVCPKKDAYVIVYLGCYDYCKGFVCEKQETNPSSSSSSSAPKSSSSSKPSSSSNSNHAVEYEYVKRTNGHWTDWSSWSKWQKTAVTESDTVKVQTKVVTEEYTYEEEIENISYDSYTLKCPDGYSDNTNGNGKDCRKVTNETKPLSCPPLSGYEVIGNDGTICTYKSTKTYDKVCPPAPSGYVYINGTSCKYRSTKSYDKICNPKSGYEVISNDGTTCTYQSTSSSPKECPDPDSGYVKMSSSGNTCKYKSTTTKPKACNSPGTGYTYVGMDGSKCVYRKYLKTEQGRSIPTDTSTRIYQYVSVELAQDCNTCGTYYLYTYKVYERKAVSKSCPDGYTELSDGTCHIVRTKDKICKSPKVYLNGGCRTKITAPAVCEDGKVELSGVCRIRIEKPLQCPENTEPLNGICVKKATKPVTCTGNNYELIGGKCKKVLYDDYDKVCHKGYTLTNDEKQCYKKDIITVLKYGTREVKMYRYATRKYVGGTVDYKWSTSKNDTYLLSQGYTLTGRTR